MALPPTASEHIEKILDRQQLRWDLQQALAREGGAAARLQLAHLREGPWITVSTELGAHGREIAARVAAELGWQVFDKEVLTTIAAHEETRARVMSRRDERALSFLDDYLTHLFVPGHVSRPEYEIELIRVVAEIGRKGSAVLVGRGAQYVLDPRYGLRIRVIGAKDRRVAHLAAQRGLSLAAAAKVVDEDDGGKLAFIRQVYHRDLTDPHAYDLLLNGPDLGVEAASRIVVAAFRAKLDGMH